MTTAGFVVLALAIVLSWAGHAIASAHLLRANNRLLKSNDDLTSQIIAFKNPAAAQLYGQMQAAQRYERAQIEPLPTGNSTEDDLLC
jgi:hypothetical protein